MREKKEGGGTFDGNPDAGRHVVCAEVRHPRRRDTRASSTKKVGQKGGEADHREEGGTAHGRAMGTLTMETGAGGNQGKRR